MRLRRRVACNDAQLGVRTGAAWDSRQSGDARGTKTPICRPMHNGASHVSAGAKAGRITDWVGWRSGEIAKAALYLASDEASLCTGTEIVVMAAPPEAPLGALILSRQCGGRRQVCF